MRPPFCGAGTHRQRKSRGRRPGACGPWATAAATHPPPKAQGHRTEKRPAIHRIFRLASAPSGPLEIRVRLAGRRSGSEGAVAVAVRSEKMERARPDWGALSNAAVPGRDRTAMPP